MIHELPSLPYNKNALEPILSAETIEYHYGKHHQTYVTNLNNLIRDTEFAEQDLITIIRKSNGAIFNNAAQVWNHTFYWNCFSPIGGGMPASDLIAVLATTFGVFDEFKKQFIQAAVANFGSGWTWLIKNPNGTLEIINTSNAGNPLTLNKTPLLTIDVWEHAYYIDYRNARLKYLESIWDKINWEFVTANYRA